MPDAESRILSGAINPSICGFRESPTPDAAMMNPRTVIAQSLTAGRSAIGTIIAFSFATSVLQFVVPLFMLQIYDRVIPSRNEWTLLTLSLVAAFLLGIFAILESLRARILVRVGLLFDHHAAEAVFEAVYHGQLREPQAGHGQVLRDVDTCREFLTGSGLLALCDAPWFPIFVVAAFVLHPLYGWIALTGSAVIVGLTLLTEFVTRHRLREATRANSAAMHNAQSALRNAEVLRAMGMLEAIRGVWKRQHDEQLLHQAHASDRAGSLVSATRCARFLLQIAILGTGAFLAIHQEVSPGSIVAASILVGRALQPIEILVTQWKSFVAVRGALRRIRTLLALPGNETKRMPLPPPKGDLALEHVTLNAPGGQRPILRDVSFVLPAGAVLAIVGPSAAGKSTLMRAIAGVWPAAEGKVRLDGHDIAQWQPEELGRHIGYLPQTVDLFAGTIAENIVRFQNVAPECALAAAREAGCHEMIQQLPEGFNTLIGEGGRGLSGGQRQRIGLARALHDSPRLVLLDEPSAHLDTQGEQALLEVLTALRGRGATTVIVSHAPGTLAAADQILLLNDGVVRGFGPSKEMLGPQARVSKGERVS
jgi:ATP-binding cassette subfamily C protein